MEYVQKEVEDKGNYMKKSLHILIFFCILKS